MSTVKTRLFIISDTHSTRIGADTSRTWSFRQPFPKADVLLHTGDLTNIGTVEENRNALALLASIPAHLKLVIAGNHDLTLDKEFWKAKTAMIVKAAKDYDASHADVVEELWSGEEAKKAGVTYLTEGLHNFTLSNGANFSVYASPWQPEFFDWAFNYAHNEDRWNPPDLISSEPCLKNAMQNVVPPLRPGNPIPKDVKVDIMMTHGPPWKHLDKTKSNIFAGCPQLLQALDRVRPRLHCFGHIHEAWGAERVVWKNNSESNETASGEVGPLGERTELLGRLLESNDPPTIQHPWSQSVVDRRAAFVDISNSSPNPLKFGSETLLVNASIMTLKYSPDQAGWLVDLELPTKE